MPLTEFAWTPTGNYPSTATSLSTIATSHLLDLSVSISNAAHSLETATKLGKIASLSKVVRGAEASISIISAEEVLATATAASVQARATDVIAKATYNLQKLSAERDFYGYQLSLCGNGLFLGVFGLMLIFFLGMLARSKYLWFNFCFVGGVAFEFIGFLARVLAAANDHDNVGYYALQGFRLGISPAFIISGLSFVFAQNVAIYGEQYSLIKPMSYPYYIIGTFIVALVIQSIGGGLAPSIRPVENDSIVGIYLMFIGLLIEVLVTAALAFFCLHFPFKAFFQDRYFVPGDSGYKKCNSVAFAKMLLNVKSARTYKIQELDRFYNPRYQGIRLRPLFHYYPGVLAFAVILMFIRSVYRMVKLCQGNEGYIISHEYFIFVFDAPLKALVGMLFVPFHPVFVFGRDNVLRVVDLDQSKDDIEGERANVPVNQRPEEFSLPSLSKENQRRPKRPQTLYMT